MSKDIKVFVYGSLKKDFGNHCVLKGSEYIGEEELDGKYRMISLGAFPGVVHDPSVTRVIYGEVYAVDIDGLTALDCLEGNGSFYTREKVKTRTGMRVWTYFLPLDEYGDEEDVVTGVWEEEWRQAL